MTARRNLLDKSFFSSGPASEASVPVIGSLLLLLILFVLVGAATTSFFNSSGGGANFQSPVVKVTLESCEGGLYGVGPTDKWVKFEENLIVLVHDGGDSIPLDIVSIKISGYGNSYQGIPDGSGNRIEGDVEVLYLDLSPEGKNSDYYQVHNKETIEDGFWDVGEKLILCGQDSAASTVDSSVRVSVGGVGNTSDNYGFKAGSEITLKVIDTEGRNILAERKAVVEFAGD